MQSKPAGKIFFFPQGGEIFLYFLILFFSGREKKGETCSNLNFFIYLALARKKGIH